MQQRRDAAVIRFYKFTNDKANRLGNEPLPDGDVKAFRTDVLVDKAAEELYPAWNKNLEQWKLTGGDHAYHYLGSAIWFTRIGHAMGEAMKELLARR